MEETMELVPQGQETEGAKTFDELLQNKAYQSEFDRRVAKALETARGKWAQEAAEAARRAEAKARAEAEERANALIETERSALREEKALFEREKRMAATERMLAEARLPREFAGYLCADTAEETEQNVAQFARLYRGAVERDINHKLKGAAPKTGGARTDPLRDAMGLR